MNDIYVGQLITRGELSHHGILGMRWGKKQGPPYPLDAGEHSAAEKKAGWRKSLEDSAAKNYREKGLSEEEAREAAAKRATLVRNVAIGAAVAVGVAAAYTAYGKYGREYCDNVIKAGTTIQTVSKHTDRMETGEAFYTAYAEGDKKKYAGMFGQNQGGENKYKIQAVANKDIKIAGSKTGEKVFDNLMKDDDNDFKQTFEQLKQEVRKAGQDRSMNGKAKSDYEIFNSFALLNNSKDADPRIVNAQKKFYAALKEQGYGAVADVNDRKYSGYNTKAAIVFDRENFAKNEQGGIGTKLQKLSDDEIQNGKKYANGALIRDALLNPSYVAVGSAYIGVASVQAYDNKVTNSKGKKTSLDNKSESKKEKKK